MPLLVDTGSAVWSSRIPTLDRTFSRQLEAIYALGTPTGISESGYSGGVDYIYLTYNSVPVDYLGGTGLDTDGPVDVEVYSWDPSNLGSLFTNDAFQNFLTDNDVNGILGIGDNTAGPTTSPFESYGGVTVDVSRRTELTYRQRTPRVTGTTRERRADQHPVRNRHERRHDDWCAVSDDVDSGGVSGTIPSSLTRSTDHRPREPRLRSTTTATVRHRAVPYTVGSGAARRRRCREPRSTAASSRS